MMSPDRLAMGSPEPPWRGCQTMPASTLLSDWGPVSNQALSDIQQTIDKLFARLDAAKSGGEITQANHALRVQITKKKKFGAALSEREREIVSAVGGITEQKRGGSWGVMILVIVVAAALYAACRFFGTGS